MQKTQMMKIMKDHENNEDYEKDIGQLEASMASKKRGGLEGVQRLPFANKMIRTAFP